VLPLPVNPYRGTTWRDHGERSSNPDLSSTADAKSDQQSRANAASRRLSIYGGLSNVGHLPQPSPKVWWGTEHDTVGGRQSVKVIIDTERCTGHGRCYSLAPEVFESDEDGHSMVLSGDISETLLARAQIGVDNCPEKAISIDLG
jgi:ferredoxin